MNLISEFLKVLFVMKQNYIIIYYYFNGKWLPIETDEPTTTIGYKRLLRFQIVKADKLRIRFKVFKDTLCINSVGAYNAP